MYNSYITPHRAWEDDLRLGVACLGFSDGIDHDAVPRATDGSVTFEIRAFVLSGSSDRLVGSGEGWEGGWPSRRHFPRLGGIVHERCPLLLGFRNGILRQSGYPHFLPGAVREYSVYHWADAAMWVRIEEWASVTVEETARFFPNAVSPMQARPYSRCGTERLRIIEGDLAFLLPDGPFENRCVFFYQFQRLPPGVDVESLEWSTTGETECPEIPGVTEPFHRLAHRQSAFEPTVIETFRAGDFAWNGGEPMGVNAPGGRLAWWTGRTIHLRNCPGNGPLIHRLERVKLRVPPDVDLSPGQVRLWQRRFRPEFEEYLDER